MSTSEQTNVSPEKTPEPSPLDEGLPLEKTIELSREGGLYADAEEIARLLGHNDPEQVKRWQETGGKGYED